MNERAIWFDLDGTLITYDRPFSTLLGETLGNDPEDAVHETYRRRLFRALEDCEDDPYVEGFSAILDAHDFTFDPAERAREYRERELAATRLVSGAKAMLKRCQRLGPVGILTNGDGEMQRAKIHRHGLDTCVDAIIISNEIGVRKPDVAIFDAARERLPAGEHVYVGDTYEEDIVPARDAGFVAVHVRNDDGPAVSVNRVDAFGTLLDTRGEGH